MILRAILTLVLLGLCGIAAPIAPTPALAQARSQKSPAADGLTPRQKLFDDLFAQLKAAPDADKAAQLRAMIESVWIHSGSATADLLTARAEAAQQHGQADLAQQLLDRIVQLYPDWPEGWRRRAQTSLALGDTEAAMADLNHALAIEPRDYLALDALAAMHQAAGQNKQALALMRQSLAIDPQNEALREATEKLAIEVEGRDI